MDAAEKISYDRLTLLISASFCAQQSSNRSFAKKSRQKKPVLTKFVATMRVFPRKSFIALMLQKAVLFDFSASSCSNSPVIMFQSETCPGLLHIILVSASFCRNLTHISAAMYGIIIYKLLCNCYNRSK